MESKVYKYMDWPEIEAVVYAEEASPKDLMAPRLTADGILIQGFFPDAEKAEVLVDKKAYEMEKQDDAGYFAAMIPGRKIPAYQYRITRGKETRTFADPYAFPGQITEAEEKAFCAGVYYHSYEKLGAHPIELNGVTGTSFAVWAPNALRVSVVGDFNNWDGRCHMMHRMPMSGIFELFIPGVKAGEIYKYEMKLKGGTVQMKSDPYAACTELPPASASVVADLRDFQWDDAKWMEERIRFRDRKQPVSIYETSLSNWKDTSELVSYVKETKVMVDVEAPIYKSSNLKESFLVTYEDNYFLNKKYYYFSENNEAPNKSDFKDRLEDLACDKTYNVWSYATDMAGNESEIQYLGNYTRCITISSGSVSEE